MTDEQFKALIPWRHPTLKNTPAGLFKFYEHKLGKRSEDAYAKNKAEFDRRNIKVIERFNPWNRYGGVERWLQFFCEPDAFDLKSLELSKAVNSDFEVPMPKGITLYPYQRAGVQYIVTRNNTFLGDEMGLGKTAQAIGAINWWNQNERKVSRIIIFTTAITVPNWEIELNRFLVGKYTISTEYSASANIMIVSHASAWKWMKSHWLDDDFDMAILDEAHFLKGRQSQRVLAIFGGDDDEGQKYIGVQATKKLALTGTPSDNRPRDVFPILNWLNPKQWRSKSDFETRYCADQDQLGNITNKGASNSEELQLNLRATILVRREFGDVEHELPKIRRSTIQVPRPKNIKKFSDEFSEPKMKEWGKKMALAKARLEFSKVDGGESYKRAVKGLMDAIDYGNSVSGPIRKATIDAKIPALIEFFEERIRDSNKFVAFGFHREPLEKLYAKFGGGLILGGTPKENFEVVQRFQEDPKFGPVWMSVSIAQGVNLTATHSGIFIEEDWRPGIIAQAEKRIHRNGQKKAVLIEHVVMEGTIDQVMAVALTEKQKKLEASFDASGESDDDEPIVPLPGLTVSRKELLAEPEIRPDVVKVLKAFCKKVEELGRENKAPLVDAYLAYYLNAVPNWTNAHACLAKRLYQHERGPSDYPTE